MDESATTPEKRRQQLIRCHIRRKPLLAIVPGGIEIKCHSCPNEYIFIDRAIIERIWADLAAGREPLSVQPGIA